MTVDGKNITSICKRICQDSKQTYNHKTYNTSMDQANECEWVSYLYSE